MLASKMFKFFSNYRHLNAEFKILQRAFSSNVSIASNLSKTWSTETKTQDWNRAISDAEKIVGYPTTFFSLKCLLSEEFNSVAMHLRKLIGTNHPILRTAKRLVYHGRTNMQTRGLVVLLLSKAAGHAPTCSDIDTAAGSGITARQQILSELTEMIYTAHLIHKGILNITPNSIQDETILHDLQFGNKISILSGDYLLANVCKGLANLRNCQVVDLISKAIADFMQAEFLGEHDKEGYPIPVHGMALSTWEEKNLLSMGSLIANSCKSTLLLADQNEELQYKGFEFGKNVALAWQVYDDLQPFVDVLNCTPGNKFDLTSLPVIFHLEKHPQKVDLIRNEIGDNVSNFDFKKLHESIMEDDSVDKTKLLLNDYLQNAEDLLAEFGSCAATKAIFNIVTSLKN